MEPKTFEDALEFAIGREREAVRFYRDLQDMVRFASQKELMNEFEDMERGHVRLLQGVLENQEPRRLSKTMPSDLHLDEFLVSSPPTPEMDYQDILLTAIQREKRSAALYTRLHTDSTDPELQDVFQRLIVEEENHKHYFETLYERDIQSEN